ncbi:MAG TPA: response regulator [Rubrivivax sp.]|nr:response regulator [Rubrivivax sp.]
MSHPQRALVVDDNALNSRLVAVFLKRLGWTAQLVDNGDDALALLARETFELVLLDLRMPHVDGVEVCRRIRGGLGLRALPVIAYTAHSTPEERQSMIDVGFSGLLVKPLSFFDLRELCAEFGSPSGAADPKVA